MKTGTKVMMNESKEPVASGVLGVNDAKDTFDLGGGVEMDSEKLIPEVNASTILMYTTGSEDPFEHPSNHWFDAEGPAG